MKNLSPERKEKMLQGYGYLMYPQNQSADQSVLPSKEEAEKFRKLSPVEKLREMGHDVSRTAKFSDGTCPDCHASINNLDPDDHVCPRERDWDAEAKDAHECGREFQKISPWGFR